MNSEPSFSIVLCTYNRARLLGVALDSILVIDYPPTDFELVLVDNGSTDDTAEVAARCAERASFPVRYVVEPARGLSAARNRGLREARGRYVFFTDDDQVVDPGVLREHLRVAERYGARVIQGRIELTFPDGRPAWLRGPLTAMLGETRDVPEGPAAIDLYGGNMSFCRSLFAEIPAFRPDLGKGASGYAEDSELTQRLRARNERIVYAPGARIHHVIGADRLTAGFFRRTSFQKGYSDGLIAEARRGAAAFLVGTALSAAAQALVAVAARATRDPHRAIVSETRALNRVGRLWGYLRARRRSPSLADPGGVGYTGPS